ncbi:unnamed protein product [Citrullus colocynthis]|uniref:Uncharacterized protein n=1 Tax=Citrullus colocynthis TaxID=252529 RepID=A0ABP0XQ16_9ROSI
MKAFGFTHFVFMRSSVSGLWFVCSSKGRGEAERLGKEKTFAFYIEAQGSFPESWKIVKERGAPKHPLSKA